MSNPRNKFIPFSVQHIYQRSLDHGVLFYTIEDRLVYYTLAAVNAKKQGVQVLAASLMFTHLHQSVVSENLKCIRDYLHNTNTSFARLYNFRYKRKGVLFENPPGVAQKKTPKDVRTNLIYVFNNHVEKGLCQKAEEERWAFLAYANPCNPFSAKKNTASQSLAKAMRLVDRRVHKAKGLEYVDLDKVFSQLTEDETGQFIDYVISRYSWIDFQATAKYFETLEAMIIAINSSTGCEYDIREEYTVQKDTDYVELAKITKKAGILSRVYSLTQEEKRRIVASLCQRYRFSSISMRKYFHMG